MKKYYRNTTPDNPNNKTIGYLTQYGDFISRMDVEDLEDFPTEFPDVLIMEIIVEAGLLSCGETYEEYCKRVGREAYHENKELFIS
jgi:hypothetical protein